MRVKQAPVKAKCSPAQPHKGARVTATWAPRAQLGRERVQAWIPSWWWAKPINVESWTQSCPPTAPAWPWCPGRPVHAKPAEPVSAPEATGQPAAAIACRTASAWLTWTSSRLCQHPSCSLMSQPCPDRNISPEPTELPGQEPEAAPPGSQLGLPAAGLGVGAHRAVLAGDAGAARPPSRPRWQAPLRGVCEAESAIFKPTGVNLNQPLKGILDQNTEFGGVHTCFSSKLCRFWNSA